MHLQPRVDAATASSLFPMPAPFPEVFRSNSGENGREVSKKKALNALVIVLNYLHFGRPRTAFQGMELGAKLSGLQWRAVRRMEKYLDAWIDCSDVGPEEMGRTAPKVEGIENVLADLENRAFISTDKHSAYFGPSSPNIVSGSIAKQQGTVIGTLSTPTPSTFKPVDPSRLTFMGRPQFDPSEFLDERSRQIFQDPLSIRTRPEDYVGKKPCLKVHCSTNQKIRLFELLDASDRLGIHTPQEVSPEFASGLFSVPKDLHRDRLILDSRGANLLESPLGRWIGALGSAEALTHLSLEQDEELLCSGNDLRDFYYLFKATPSRSRRNCLVGPIHPSKISHLSAVKACHQDSKVVFGSLRTLAMGDCQAVELAQTCHLSMGLQRKIFSPDMLVTLTKPIPRTTTLVGVVIDDFISLEKQKVGACKSTLQGGKIADDMQQLYRDVKLIPHEKKAFRNETNSSFWGIDIDGQQGILRGSLKRAIPLAGIMLKVALLGIATCDLLQILAGSIISLFLFRRRFLSLLDSLFSHIRGRDPRSIVSLSGRLRSDLIIFATLLPFSATNLRCKFQSRIVATDASSWGEAGCYANVPKPIVKELHRYCLRKSLWTRLLSPAAAWQRMHDVLSAEDELPGDTCYKMNPLWQICAEALQYQPLFVQQKRGQRHINIGEVRAALKAESILALQSPESRELFGLDSQVGLGSLIKGRSASPSINEELVRSIPTVVAQDIISNYMYYETSCNPADDGTRGRALRQPRLQVPVWWQSLADGDFEDFDRWLAFHELDDLTLSGLPCFSELGYNVPSFDRCDPKDGAIAVVGAEESAASDAIGLANPLGATMTTDEPQCTEPSSGSLAATTELSQRQLELLGTFNKDQFVGLTSWPPQGRGFLDLFSGERAVAEELAAETGTWVLCFDIAHSPSEDLLDESLQAKLEELLTLKTFLGVGAAPVCSSFSTAITPAVRTALEPYGISTCSERMKEKLADGNAMALWVFHFLELALILQLGVWLENPINSWMFRLPEWRRLKDKYGLDYWVVDYCRFGKKWRKRTRFATNTAISGMKTLCKGNHVHQMLRGRSHVHRMSWTLVAQPYPRGVARAVALSLAEKAGCIQFSSHFDPAACARCGHCRVGEASNPGPLSKLRAEVLEEVPLVEPKTVAIQTRALQMFNNWLDVKLSRGARKSVFRSAPLLAVFLKEFGNHLYSTGRALYIYRHLVVVLQQEVPGFKPYAGICWDMVSRWQLLEPIEHRTPIPSLLVMAVLSVAISWRWFRFASIVGLSFFGLARPGEPLAALREHLVLPSDLLDPEISRVYMKVAAPKGRKRGIGRVQHISIDFVDFIIFLENHLKRVAPGSRIYPGSFASFSRRWYAVLQSLSIPRSANLSPGGLRGGGAVWAFHRGSSVQEILWRMRLKQLSTLESYLQELAAHSVMSSLSVEARRKVRLLGVLGPLYLRHSSAILF